MRYTITIIAAFIVLTTSSCLKKYECECLFESYSSSGVEKSTHVDELHAISKKDAREACNLGDDDDVNETKTFGSKRECELK